MNTFKNILNLTELQPLARSNYFGRIVYTGCLSVLGIPILIQNGNSEKYFITIIAVSLIWPQIALLLLKRSRNQRWFEININLNIDAVIVGTWGPIFQFNPFAILTYLVTVGTGAIVNGGLKILSVRLLYGIAAICVSTLIFGFRFNAESSPLVIIMSGMCIITVTWISSLLSYSTHRQLNVARKIMGEQKARMEELSSKLSKYLSPQIYDSIFTGKRDVRIETARKKLTIFFSDIKDFTMTTDNMEAEDLSSLLNSYLNEMSLIALKHGGTIDKYIGDAIMIFFGDPESRGEKEDAVRCVSMAIEMRNRMISLREEWHATGIVSPLHIRIGINTGFCTVGNFGSDERLDYTAIGGQVNMASRLQACAEPDRILVSYDTYLLIRDIILCRETGEIQVKGISKPVKTFQVIDYHEKVPKGNYLLREERQGISVEIDLTRAEASDAADLFRDILRRMES